MEKAQDIDEMSQIHVKYVAKLQERALLSKAITPICNAIVAMLDLGISFAQAIEAVSNATSKTDMSPTITNQRHQNLAHAIPIRLVQNADSDAAGEDDDAAAGRDTATNQRILGHNSTLPLDKTLETIDADFARLLPFITAGLRSVGRVGAEPMWEQLAERLEMETVKSGLD